MKKLDLLVIANDFEFLKTHRLDLLEYLNKEGLVISVLTDLDNISHKDIVEDIFQTYKPQRVIHYKFSPKRACDLFTDIPKG